MRKIIFTLHLCVGLLVGIFIAILGITGSLMAFEPEIDHLVHHQLTYVQEGKQTLSLAGIGQKVNNSFPADTITRYWLSTSAGISWQVDLQDRTVFVNPYTGSILGVRSEPDHWQDLQTFIHQLHLRLGLMSYGKTGKAIMSWAGLGILILQLSGLILWWKQKRWTIGRKGTARRIWFDLHNTIGIFAYIFLFLLAATGVIIGFADQTTPSIYKITGSQPEVVPEFTVVIPQNTQPISPDSALTIARQAIPGAYPFLVNVPGQGDVYQVGCRFPEDLTPGGRSEVIIDPYSGKVLFKRNSRNAPAGTRILTANRAIHTGDIFGLPSKIIMSLASLATVALFISGVVMWWKRR